MIDVSAAADTVAAIVPAGPSGMAPWDAHTLSTLWPDLFHTTVYATLGLVGAYVTQARDAFFPFHLPSCNPSTQ